MSTTVTIIGIVLLITGIIFMIWGAFKGGFKSTADTQWQVMAWGGVALSIIGLSTALVGNFAK